MWILAAFFLLGMPFSLPVTAGGAPRSAAAVLARAKTAQGGLAWDSLRSLHTRGELRTAALHGPFDSFDDVLTGRHHDRYDLGAVSGENGFDGTRAWTVDPGGAVHVEVDGAARAAAINEAWRRSLSYWTRRRAGRISYVGVRREAHGSYQVVAVKPVGGRRFELWVDAASGLFDRIVEPVGSETLTTFFSDYRDVRGLKLPFALRVVNGDPKYDQLYIIASVEVDVAIETASFAVPPSVP